MAGRGLKWLWTLAAIAVVAVAGWIALGDRAGRAKPAGDIAAVRAKHEARLMAVPGVVGVGVGECDAAPCIKVLVSSRTPEVERDVPRRLDGFDTDVEVVGAIAPQPSRPAPD
jgi:hypothetical protein